MVFFSCYNVPNNCFSFNCVLNADFKGHVSDFVELKVVKIPLVTKVYFSPERTMHSLQHVLVQFM